MTHRLTLFSSSNLSLGGAGAYVVTEQVKPGVELMQYVILHLSADVYLTVGTLVQLIAVGIGVFGLVLKCAEWVRLYLASRKNKK